MGKGSRDDERQRLLAAGYTKGHSMHQPRCSGCTHCVLSSKPFQTTYDRHCKLLDAGVKTHGACRMHKTAASAH